MNQACSTVDLQLALEGRLPPDREQTLYRHLDHCEACRTAMGEMAGLTAWCDNAARLLAGDELDEDVPSREEWSDVDFTVEHLEPADGPNALGRLGGYDVLEVIGRGGMGVVLKGFDRELNRYIAIKVLSPQFARSSLAKKRFAREAQAAAAVVHPHVMAIHQVQAGGPLPFLVMPLVAGESLAERLVAHGRLELKETLRIGMQAAAGLAAAHEQGIIHRDVKPANILLEKGVERAVLADFGLARAGDDVSMTRCGVIAGTPEYMSPEQARGEPLDGRSDLFSLGCVLYEMATGTSAFRADTTLATLRRLIDEQPATMASLNAELPPWFIKIVERLLEKDPARRFASAKEVSELLEKCLAHVQQPNHVPLPPASADVRPVQESIRSRIRISRNQGVSIMVSLLGIGLLAAAIAQTSPPEIAGNWSNDDWGKVALTKDADGSYSGTFSQTEGGQPGKIHVKWSRIDRRYNGTWSDGDVRFGTISLHLVDDRIQGAAATDAKSRPNTPQLAEFIWTRGAGAVATEKPTGTTAAVDILAPFIGDDTVGVGRVDFSRVSAGKAFDMLAAVHNIPEPQLRAQAREFAEVDAVTTRLVEVGAKELYLTLDVADEHNPSVLAILPLPAGGDERAVRAALPPPFRDARRVGNALALRLPPGDATAIEVNTAKRREEFAPAIECAQANAAWAVFAPSTHTRRLVERMMPQLPQFIGGGPVTVVTRDLSWASLGINGPPEAAVHVVVKLRDVEAAKEIGRRWSEAVRAAGKGLGIPPGTAEFDSQVSLFSPIVDGDCLLWSIDKHSRGLAAALATVTGSLRREADEMRSMNNLRQFGVAMINYQDTFQHLPAPGGSGSAQPPMADSGPQLPQPSTGAGLQLPKSNLVVQPQMPPRVAAVPSGHPAPPSRKPLLSWRVHILPFIEQDALYRQFHLDEPWDSPHNRPLVEKMPEIFRSPGSTAQAGKTNYVVPVGNGALWSSKSDEPRLVEITDGCSNTIMIVAVDDAHAVTWTQPDDLVFDPKSPRKNIGSPQGGGFLAAFADGAVRLIGGNVSDATLAALFTRAGGEPVDQSQLDANAGGGAPQATPPKLYWEGARSQRAAEERALAEKARAEAQQQQAAAKLAHERLMQLEKEKADLEAAKARAEAERDKAEQEKRDAEKNNREL
jgi:serine/threonine protein kinase